MKPQLVVYGMKRPRLWFECKVVILLHNNYDVFACDRNDMSDNMIDMTFSKKRVEDRKHWLLALEPGTHMNYAVDDIGYDSFVNNELILFSHADNQRSIPHFMDGFKPSQRKVS